MTPPKTNLNALLPMSLLLALASFSYWLTSTANATSRNTQDIAALQADRNELLKELVGMRTDIASISAKLGMIRDYLVEPQKRNTR